MREGLTFNNVSLVPKKSNVLPRQVNTEVYLDKKIKLEIPILSAPMDTVTESRAALALGQEGGLGIIHRNFNPAAQVREVKKVKRQRIMVGAAVGIGTDTLKRAEDLIKARVDILVVDSAHGHFSGVLTTIKMLKKEFPAMPLIAGNVATAEATKDLIKAGADIVKVGIGPGSISATRQIAGVGVPQITALIDCVKIAKKTKTPVVADGGISNSGEIVKALAAGASAVMLGKLLSGTWEAPGEVITDADKNKFKIYHGAKYSEIMPGEGASKKIPYQGGVDQVINSLIEGLRSGMGYCGVRDIPELWVKAEFMRLV